MTVCAFASLKTVVETSHKSVYPHRNVVWGRRLAATLHSASRNGEIWTLPWEQPWSFETVQQHCSQQDPSTARRQEWGWRGRRGGCSVWARDLVIHTAGVYGDRFFTRVVLCWDIVFCLAVFRGPGDRCSFKLRTRSDICAGRGDKRVHHEE